MRVSVWVWPPCLLHCCFPFFPSRAQWMAEWHGALAVAGCTALHCTGGINYPAEQRARVQQSPPRRRHRRRSVSHCAAIHRGACGGKAAAPAQPCAAPSSIIRARPGWTVVVDVRSLGCFCHSVVDATSCSALVDWATDGDVPANAWRSGRQVFKPGSRAVRSLAHPLCVHARRRPNTNSSLPLPHLSSVLLRTCSIPFHEASNKVR
jgi:hypothetical protein